MTVRDPLPRSSAMASPALTRLKSHSSTKMIWFFSRSTVSLCVMTAQMTSSNRWSKEIHRRLPNMSLEERLQSRTGLAVLNLSPTLMVEDVTSMAASVTPVYLSMSLGSSFPALRSLMPFWMALNVSVLVSL